MGTMEDFILALKSYAYGSGWLVISILFAIAGFKLFDKLSPINFQKEIEEKNTAFALLMGMFLLGLTFGILFLAAHLA